MSGPADTDTDTSAGDRAEGGIADEAREALRWYGDSAYGSGELRDAIERAGDPAVIKPKPVTPAGSPWTTSPSTRTPAS